VRVCISTGVLEDCEQYVSKALKMFTPFDSILGVFSEREMSAQNAGF